MDLEVSNLNLSLIEADLQRLFTPFGEVSLVHLYRDKVNNRSKGRALIQMPIARQAQKAMESLKGVLLAGQRLIIQEVPN